MNRLHRTKGRRQRGVTAYAVILTVAVLAILSHNLVHQALMDYRFGALVRDTIALEQLTDSALERALHYLGRAERAGPRVSRVPPSRVWYRQSGPPCRADRCWPRTATQR